MLQTLMGSMKVALLSGAMLAVVLAGAAQAKAPVVTPVAGTPTLLLGNFDLGALGYSVEEFFVSGEAASYAPAAPMGIDGRWSVKPAGTAPYITRIVVVRPTDPAKFNGTAVVEWLNVSGGLDAPADWFMAHRELIRSGYAYVGVSAQKVGIEGGPSLGADMSLKKTHPERYGQLSHPGDAFAFDIYSQAGRLVRDAGHSGVLGPLKPKYVLASGESQSAHFMTTYVNAVDPLAKVYDGFLVHSRFNGSAPLDGRSMMGGQPSPDVPQVVKFRPDLRVPVLTLITETDLIGGGRAGYYPAREPDTDRLRVWEIAGTSHADNYTIQVAPIDSGTAPLAQIAAAYAPMSTLMGMKLPGPINAGPQHHYVVEAAFSSLNHWVRTGRPPASTPRLEVEAADHPHLVLDANGLARGGIRSPWVDVPTMRLSGISKGGNIMSSLFGTSEPFDAATLQRLYPGGRAEYLAHFEVSLDAAIKAGQILPADRREILDLAALMYPGPQ